MLRSLFPALMVVFLPGCASISALTSASERLEIYELQSPQIAGLGERRGAVELVIEEPSASGALNTDRILIRPSPLQAQYLPGVRWADPAPQMLQTLLLRSLTETGAFQSVGRRPIGSIGDFAVLTELTEFGARPLGPEVEQAQAEIRVMIRLVRERDATVIASRSFAATAITNGTEADAIVSGFNRATSDLFAEIVPWLVSAT